MNNIDFVIPLHRYHYLLRTVLESIELFYEPRIIYIITPKIYCNYIEVISKNWLIKKIIMLSEEDFFLLNYNLHYNDIFEIFNNEFNEKSREFGWWYQQILKLSAFTQIKNLSDPYIVWDSDLIPITKWEIYPNIENQYYHFAILQEKARNEWNTIQYNSSIIDLIGIEICSPNIGTFVPHHYVFHHHVLKHLIKYIEIQNKDNWIKSIIKLSHKYFRFSEYHMVSTFMKKYYPQLLNYYCYSKFGKYGERIREPSLFLKEMEVFLKENTDNVLDVSYTNFLKFIATKYDKKPSYLQIEHI